MLIENAPVVRKKIRRQVRFLIKFFKYINPIQKITEMAHRVGAVFAPVPQKFEAGTVNAAGAVGLAAAIRYLQEKGFDYTQKKELELTQRAMEGLGALPYVHILGSKDPANHTGIVSFTI